MHPRGDPGGDPGLLLVAPVTPCQAWSLTSWARSKPGQGPRLPRRPCETLDMQHLASGPCGLMDKALVFGTKDCRFESCQGHLLVGAHVKCTNVQAQKANEPNHVPLISRRTRTSPRRPTLGQGVQGTSNNRCDSKRPTKDDQRTPALHRT